MFGGHPAASRFEILRRVLRRVLPGSRARCRQSPFVEWVDPFGEKEAMRAARVGGAWPIPALLLLAVLWTGAAEAFMPSLPSIGGIRRVPVRPGVSTLVGAIGRGRGTPNEDIWQLGEDQVEKNKAKKPRTPAAARKKNVVRPGRESDPTLPGSCR